MEICRNMLNTGKIQTGKHNAQNILKSEDNKMQFINLLQLLQNNNSENIVNITETQNMCNDVINIMDCLTKDLQSETDLDTLLNNQVDNKEDMKSHKELSEELQHIGWVINNDIFMNGYFDDSYKAIENVLNINLNNGKNSNISNEILMKLKNYSLNIHKVNVNDNASNFKNGVKNDFSDLNDVIDDNINLINLKGKITSQNLNKNDSDIEKSEFNNKDISKIIIDDEDIVYEDIGVNKEITNILSNNRNEIINISDESNEIKSSVNNQVKEQIEIIVKETDGDFEGTKEIEMKLNPDKLGKLDIKVKFDKDNITIEIKAENKDVQKLIESNSDDLIQILGKSEDRQIDIVFNTYEKTTDRELNKNNQEHNNHNQNKNNNQNEEHTEDEPDSTSFADLVRLKNIFMYR